MQLELCRDVGNRDDLNLTTLSREFNIPWKVSPLNRAVTLSMMPGDRKNSNSGGAFRLLQSKNSMLYNICNCRYIIKISIYLCFFRLY